VGFTRQGWGPGDLQTAGRTRNPAGRPFASFDAFLETVRSDWPFAFWFGSQDPHRPYDPGSGARAGLRAVCRLGGWKPAEALAARRPRALRLLAGAV
jgi:hypothetical protein